MENEEIIDFIQQFCREKVFEKRGERSRYHDDYNSDWLQFAKRATGQDIRDEKLSSFTHKQIQDAVKRQFGEKNIGTERRVGGDTQLSFDLYNPSERTAFEICLSAIKNEFEKDILKAMLDSETVTLVILYREYRVGAEGTLYGRKWFEEPAQKAKMELVERYKTKIQVFPLVPDGELPQKPSTKDLNDFQERVDQGKPIRSAQGSIEAMLVKASPHLKEAFQKFDNRVMGLNNVVRKIGKYNVSYSSRKVFAYVHLWKRVSSARVYPVGDSFKDPRRMLIPVKSDFVKFYYPLASGQDVDPLFDIVKQSYDLVSKA